MVRGSSAFSVGVQVPPAAPFKIFLKRKSMEQESPKVIDLECVREAKELDRLYQLINGEEGESFYNDLVSVKED